jgi:hypothetical protein
LKISKASTIFFPEKLFLKIRADVKMAIVQYYNVFQDHGFDYLQDHFNNKDNFFYRIDFKDFPPQYHKFIGKPHPFSIYFRIYDEPNKVFEGGLTTAFPDSSEIMLALVKRMFLTYSLSDAIHFVLTNLKHELAHVVQNAISISWDQSKGKIPPQFDLRGKGYESATKEQDKWRLSPVEFDPIIISSVNRFVKYDIPFKSNDMKKFVRNDPFFKALENDLYLYELAVKKFYQLLTTKVA